MPRIINTSKLINLYCNSRKLCT